MHSLRLVCGARRKDLLLADLWERETTGIIEEELPDGGCVVKAFFAAPFDASSFQEFSPEWAAEEERDWTTHWQASWEPVLVGERFFLVPEWRGDPAPAGRLRLVIHPGVAFGTGADASTQLCLEALERHLRPGDRVLDFGTGAGILSEGARLLGAGRIVAFDIDLEAAKAARRNLPAEIAVFAGSTRSIRPAAFDMLLGNLNAATIRQSAAEMRLVLAQGGRAITS